MSPKQLYFDVYRTGKVMNKKLGVEVWYLFHSGFAVKKDRKLFIFDYYNNKPFKKIKSLDGGIVNPAEIKDLEVTVFASHVHKDHFIPSVLKWRKEIPGIHYVLSYDINPGTTENVVKAFPNASYELDGIKVRTLKSTDEGVAFIVETDGLKIYHAGDLHWWHWDGEPEEENNAMAKAFKEEIDKLKGERFDIAFVPVDYRLENEYLWGLDYFMKLTDAKIVFPMHFWNHYSILNRLDRDPMADEYRDRIIRISRRGERFEI